MRTSPFLAIGLMALLGITANAFGNNPPEITLLTPITGKYFPTGPVMNLTVSAEDSDGTIALVEYYADEIKIGESDTAPFSFNWENAPAGTHLFRAVAYDNENASTGSNYSGIVIMDGPFVCLLAPDLDSLYELGDSIALVAAAGDKDHAITLVEFFCDGVKVGESTQAPYWMEMEGATAGDHEITVHAYIENNAVPLTDAADIFINIPPQAAIISPDEEDELIDGETYTVQVDASDSDGTVAMVQLFDQGELVGTITSAPYNFEWYAVEGEHELTVEVTDDLDSTIVSDPYLFTVEP